MDATMSALFVSVCDIYECKVNAIKSTLQIFLCFYKLYCVYLE